MKYPLWKPAVLIGIVLACAAAITFAGINRGIDLAGGTTLTYAVSVPEGEKAETVIEDTIEILKERVDPSGIMNLIWRSEAGNRLTVQMPMAPADVAEKRDVFEALLAEMVSRNLPEAAITAALASPPAERDAALERLASEFPEKQAQFDALIAAAAERDRAQARYEAALQTLEEAEADASLEGEDLEPLRVELDSVTDELIRERQRFADARDAVTAGNLTGAEVTRALEADTKVPRGRTQSARDEAIAQLKADHTGRTAEISALVDAWNDYEAVKGPLDDPEDLIRTLQGAGVLEFRIAANPEGEPLDVQRYIDRLEQSGPKAGRTDPWRWFEIESLDDFVDNAQKVAVIEQTTDPAQVQALFAADFRSVVRPYGGSYYMLLGNDAATAMRGTDDWALTGAGRGADSYGKPALDFSLDAPGGKLMRDLTRAHLKRPMAIVLDGQVFSAPTLQGAIGSRGQISGNFTAADIRYLRNTLKAGSLGSTLSQEPIAQQTTGPELGEDNLRAGIAACVTALIAVAIFMALYYFWAGLIADFALFANMVIILGVMALFEATFTLPGIAGLVLTIGMAVDANVLIFERYREEKEAGLDTRAALRQGYDKALSSILDANITTLLTCIVLYYTATSEIKGFAIVLGIGIVSTLFTVLFGSKVLIDMVLAFTKTRDIAMLPTAVPAVGRALTPNINWFALRKFFLPLSLLIIVAGGSILFTRGADLLDIEFRSGTEVTFDLAEGEALSTADARDRLADAADTLAADPPAGTESSVEWALLDEAKVVTIGERTDEGATGFRVSTLIEDADAVSAAVKTAFGDLLDSAAPIAFRGIDAGFDAAVRAGAVREVRTGNLADDLERPELAGRDSARVGDALGGVVLLLEDLRPAASVADIEQRITSMRRQPDFEALGYRQTTVVPAGDPVGVGDDNAPLYDAVAVVVTDNSTNYIEDPASFSDPGGLAATEFDLVGQALQRDTSLASVSNFSSQVSSTMQSRAIAAMALSLLVVIAYIALRFGNVRYGFAAIVALAHDVAAALGLLALAGLLAEIPGAEALLFDDFKIDLAIIAAILTLIGYSLNDTIIVFDRIRENRGRLPHPTPQIINDSINQTISRTVLTSGTTLLAVLVLYLLGGPGVHGFAFTMLIGVVVGTYSSFAIATPILLLGVGKEKAKRDVAPARASTA